MSYILINSIKAILLNDKNELISLGKIKSCKEILYPVGLAEFLPDILACKYPESPIEINYD